MADSREARFAAGGNEQATKERLDAKRAAEWAELQRANESGRKALVGTCEDMCAEYEREKRQRETAVAVFEKDPLTGRIDPARAVKSFMRPSQQDIVPSDLRPPRVLKRTLDYLFHEVMPSAPFATTMKFIWDRIRSVRQDLTIQNSRGPDAIELIERCARYYIIAIHEMRGDANLDAKLTNDQLNGTLKTLVEAYRDARQRGEQPSPNEAEFYAYYLAFAYDASTLYQIEQLPASLLEQPELATAMRICALFQRNNRKQGAHSGRNMEMGLNAFSRFFKAIADDNVSYLLACVFEFHFADVRVGALVTMHKAYRLRAEMALVDLAQRLGCDDDDHCAEICREYNVPLVEEDGIAVAAVMHSKYTEMDDHTNKLMPWGRPSRRLIDHKRRGASFPDLCDGKTGTAPPTPVTAPVARLMPVIPTLGRSLRSPSGSNALAAMPPLTQDVPVVQPPKPSPFSFNAAATPFKPSSSLTPPKPAEPVLPAVATVAPAFTAPAPVLTFEAPLPPKTAPKQLSPLRTVVEPPKQASPAPIPAPLPSPTLKLSQSTALGKRKASATATSSPQVRRAAPLPAAVLRRQRLDALAPPLVELLIDQALVQLVRDAAIDSRLDLSAQVMDLQKDYRAAMVDACARELTERLFEEIIAEVGVAGRIDSRLLRQSFENWQVRFDHARDQQEWHEEMEETFMDAAVQVGQRGPKRSTDAHDVSTLLRLGRLDISLDPSQEIMSIMDDLSDAALSEVEEDAGLWRAGTLVDPLLHVADRAGGTGAWKALVSVDATDSLTASWWRCKLDIATGEDSLAVPPLEVQLLGGSIVDSQDLVDVALLLFDVVADAKGSYDASRKRLEALTGQLRRDCRHRPDLALVFWTPTAGEADAINAVLTTEARAAYARITAASVGEEVDEELAQQIASGSPAPLRNPHWDIERTLADVCANLLKIWTTGCRRALSLASASEQDALLKLVRAHVGILSKTMHAALDALSSDAELQLPTLGISDPPSLRDVLQASIDEDEETFDGFRDTLASLPPVDDVTLAGSFLDHLALSVSEQLRQHAHPQDGRDLLVHAVSQLQQDLASALAKLKRELKPATPKKATTVKRPASSPEEATSSSVKKRQRDESSSPAKTLARVELADLTKLVQQARTLLDE